MTRAPEVSGESVSGPLRRPADLVDDPLRSRLVADDPLPLRYEIARKTIHLATVALPIAIWFLPRPWALGLLAFGVTGALTVEWARSRIRWARYTFLTRTRRLLRHHERRRFAGATYMAIGYFIAYLVFPLEVAVAAMLYNGLGDTAAAVVGKRWGTHRLASGKSWEGAGAAAAVNFGVGLLIPGIGIGPAAAGGVAAALIETAPIPIDDNLLVTVAGGAALWAGIIVL